MKNLFFLVFLVFFQFTSAQNIDECRKVVQLTTESITNASTSGLNDYLADDFSIAGQKGEIARVVLSQLLSQLGEIVKSSKETNIIKHDKALELIYSVEYEKMGIKEATFLFNEENQLQELNLFKMEVKTMSNESEVLKSSKNVIEVPFEMVSKLLAVDVILNGTRRKFILDSGAPKTILNSSHTKNGKAERTISSSKGVGGNISGMDIEKVTSLDFNGIQLNDQELITLDLSHLEKELEYEFYGLIGYDLIKDYDIIFDYEKDTVTLIRAEAYEDYKNEKLWSSRLETIPFELKGHIPVIEAKINETILKFGIDCGAESNLIDDDLFQILKKSTSKIKTDELIGADNNVKEVIKGRISKMTIGDKLFEKLNTSFSDISHLNKAYQLNLDGLIGYPILSQQKTLISYRRKELIFID